MRVRTGGLMLAIALSCGSWAAPAVRGDDIHANERLGQDLKDLRDDLRHALRDARQDVAREHHWMIADRDQVRRHAESFRTHAREMGRQLRAQMHELRDQIRESARALGRELRAQHDHRRGWI